MHEVTTMEVVVLRQTKRMPFHRSGKAGTQCHAENRKRRTVPETEPNQAAFEIALPYTCGPEIRVANELFSTRDAQAGTREGSRSGGGDRCIARAVLRSPLFPLAAASTGGRSFCRRSMAADGSREHKCRLDEGCRQYTSGGRAPPAPSTSSETCQPCSRLHQPVAQCGNRTSQPRMSRHGAAAVPAVAEDSSMLAG